MPQRTMRRKYKEAPRSRSVYQNPEAATGGRRRKTKKYFGKTLKYLKKTVKSLFRL